MCFGKGKKSTHNGVLTVAEDWEGEWQAHSRAPSPHLWAVYTRNYYIIDPRRRVSFA